MESVLWDDRKHSRTEKTRCAAMILIASLLVIVVSACVPITVPEVMQKARAIDTTVDTDTTIDTTHLHPVSIEFGQELMTDARAKTIAETAGFKYINWRPCSGSLQHCTIFKVQGQRGNIFDYHVVDQRCTTIEGGPFERPILVSEHYASRARSIKLKPAENRGFKPLFEQSVDTPQEEGNATSCFAGYTAMLRVRQENSYTSDNTGYTLVLEHVYQVLKDKRWTDTFIVLNNVWQVPVSGTGLTNQGYSYEFLDGAGTLLSENRSESNLIASSVSGAGYASLAERCEAVKNIYRTNQGVAVAASYLACTLLPIPQCASIEATFEPLGVGGGGSLSKCTDTCGAGRDALNSLFDSAAAEMYGDCIENPGRYFPADYSDKPGGFVVEVEGFKLFIPDTIIAEGGSCDPFQVIEIAFSAAGLQCITNVPSTCEENSQGKCECRRDERIGNEVTTVCTS